MIFLYGQLLLEKLRFSVLGRAADLLPARALGWTAVSDPDGSARLVFDAAGVVSGGLLDAEAGDMARLAFYASAFGQNLSRIQVEAGAQGAMNAQCFFAEMAAQDPQSAQPPGNIWALESLSPARADLLSEAAETYMSRFGQDGSRAAARFYPQILQRVASTQRAKAEPSARGIRRGGGSVQLEAARLPYRAFFEVAEQDLRYPKFDGSYSGTTTRAAFLMADAVTVLPYDPVSDRVMMVEQFRMGPHLRGDLLPWTLEPIAGRIDGDEPAELCARREAVEEAGVTLGRMIKVAGYYPTAGAVTEYIYSFIGLADLPLSAAGVGGLAEEEEDIKAHLLSFDEAMAMLDRGEIETAPLVLSLLYLARLRPALRAELGL